MSPDPENELYGRCRAGELAAWDELFDRHYAATLRFVFQLGPRLSRREAEDICRDVFTEVIRKFNSFTGQCQLQAWIFRLAIAKTRADLRAKPADQASAPESATGATGVSPAATTARVSAVLDQLEDMWRELVELRYFGNLSPKEIGRALKLDHKVVTTRLNKCLAAMEEIAQADRVPPSSTTVATNE